MLHATIVPPGTHTPHEQGKACGGDIELDVICIGCSRLAAPHLFMQLPCCAGRGQWRKTCEWQKDTARLFGGAEQTNSDRGCLPREKWARR